MVRHCLERFGVLLLHVAQSCFLEEIEERSEGKGTDLVSSRVLGVQRERRTCGPCFKAEKGRLEDATPLVSKSHVSAWLVFSDGILRPASIYPVSVLSVPLQGPFRVLMHIAWRTRGGGDAQELAIFRFKTRRDPKNNAQTRDARSRAPFVAVWFPILGCPIHFFKL